MLRQYQVMDINLRLSKSVASQMLELCNSKLPEAKSKAEQAQREYEELLEAKVSLEKSLSSLNGSPEGKHLSIEPPRKEEVEVDTQSDQKVEYNPKWSNLKKSIYIIYQDGKPLTTKEIVDTILEKYEPELKSERAKIVGNISSVLGTAAKEGKLKRALNVLGENIYGLPDDFVFKNQFQPQAMSAGFVFN